MDKSPIHKGCVDFYLKRNALGAAPAYAYYFQRELPDDDAGAFHSAELWYMFGTLERSWRPFTDHDVHLSEQMLDYWTNFMKIGNPAGKNCEPWMPCSREEPFVKIFE